MELSRQRSLRVARALMAATVGRLQLSPHFGACLCILALTCAYYTAIAPLLLAHTDLGWHLAAGDLIRSQASIPALDPWSFTAGDKRWFNLSWLWDVLASLLAAGGQTAPLLVVTIALGGAIALGLGVICMASGASPLASGIAVTAAAILYPTFAAPDIFLAASPNIATLCFCVTFYGVSLHKRHLWLMPAAMVLWVNMHGGFVLGLLILGAFAGVALLKRDGADFKTYSLLGVACVAATLVNPLGWHVYQGVASTLGHFVQQYITEWQPLISSIKVPQAVPALFYILVFVVLELSERDGPAIEARLLSWCFLVLGFWQLRYLSIFFLFSTVPLAIHLTRRLAGRIDIAAAGRGLAAIGVAVAAALPFLYWQTMSGGGEFAPIYPEAEIAWLGEHLPHVRLLNHWNYGGILIYRQRGTIPVFVDGRAATAYPDPLLRDYFKLISWQVDEAAWSNVLEKYRIGAVLWPQAHTQLAQFLVEQNGWTLVYAGPIANIYVPPVPAHESEAR